MRETTTTLRDSTKGVRITLDCDHTYRAAMAAAEVILASRDDLSEIEGVNSGQLTGTPTADFRTAPAHLGRIGRDEMRRVASGPYTGRMSRYEAEQLERARFPDGTFCN